MQYHQMFVKSSLEVAIFGIEIHLYIREMRYAFMKKEKIIVIRLIQVSHTTSLVAATQEKYLVSTYEKFVMITKKIEILVQKYSYHTNQDKMTNIYEVIVGNHFKWYKDKMIKTPSLRIDKRRPCIGHLGSRKNTIDLYQVVCNRIQDIKIRDYLKSMFQLSQRLNPLIKVRDRGVSSLCACFTRK